MIEKGTIYERNDVNIILNAIRLLTRFLPFVFEKSANVDHNEIEEEVFWKIDETNGLAYGEKLCRVLKDLVFLPGFSVPIRKEPLKEHQKYQIWEVGIGYKETTILPASNLDSNRIEILRLFLTFLSSQLYLKPSKLHGVNVFHSNRSS
jgi:hypothetical protein